MTLELKVEPVLGHFYEKQSLKLGPKTVIVVTLVTLEFTIIRLTFTLVGFEPLTLELKVEPLLGHFYEKQSLKV